MSVNSVGIDTLDLAIICEHTGQPTSRICGTRAPVAAARARRADAGRNPAGAGHRSEVHIPDPVVSGKDVQ